MGPKFILSCRANPLAVRHTVEVSDRRRPPVAAPEGASPYGDRLIAREVDTDTA